MVTMHGEIVDLCFKRIVTKDHMEVWFSKRKTTNESWKKEREGERERIVSIDILHWFQILLSSSPASKWFWWCYYILQMFESIYFSYKCVVLLWKTHKSLHKNPKLAARLFACVKVLIILHILSGCIFVCLCPMYLWKEIMGVCNELNELYWWGLVIEWKYDFLLLIVGTFCIYIFKFMILK